MHTLNSMNRKGQTLIEVMMALTIMIIVFAGVVNLVLRVFNISMSARNMTKASTIAQYGISQSIKNIQGSCNLQEIDPGDPAPILQEDIEDFRLVVYRDALNPSTEKKSDKEIDDTNFYKLKATVCWVDKGLPGDGNPVCQNLSPNARSFDLSQLVAK